MKKVRKNKQSKLQSPEVLRNLRVEFRVDPLSGAAKKVLEVSYEDGPQMAILGVAMLWFRISYYGSLYVYECPTFGEQYFRPTNIDVLSSILRIPGSYPGWAEIQGCLFRLALIYVE